MVENVTRGQRFTWALIAAMAAAITMLVLGWFTSGPIGSLTDRLPFPFGLLIIAAVPLLAGLAAGLTLSRLAKKQLDLRRKAWLALALLFIPASLVGLLGGMWVRYVLGGVIPIDSPQWVGITIYTALTILFWAVTAAWLIGGSMQTTVPAERRAKAVERGSLLAQLAPIVAAVMMLVMLFAPSYSGGSSTTDSEGNTTVEESTMNSIEANGPIVVYYALIVLAVTLVAAYGGRKASTSFVWPPTIVLMFFAVIGAFSIGMHIFVPAAWLLFSALLLQMGKARPEDAAWT